MEKFCLLGYVSFHVNDEKISVFDFSGPASLALYFPGAVVRGGRCKSESQPPTMFAWATVVIRQKGKAHPK